MTQIFQKLYALLDARERRRGALVCLMLVVVAVAEALGVASIMPFIAVLSNPDMIESNPFVRFGYEWLGFDERRTFLLFLGGFFFFFFLGSLIAGALGVWARLRFSQHRELAWGSRLLRGYLRQPYEWFLGRHSADLGTSVLAEVRQVVQGALFTSIGVISQSLIVILLLGLLIAVDPLLALVVGGVFGGCFLLISMLLRRRMRKIGAERREANRRRFHVVQEGFTGIKEVKLAGLEQVIVNRYRGPAGVLASRQISAGLMGELPSYVMQALLFGGMLLVLLYLIARYGSFQEALPIVSLYAFAGYRLMPAIQGIYRNVSTMRFTEAAVDALHEDLVRLAPCEVDDSAPGISSEQGRTGLQNEIELREVNYRYPGATRYALRNLSMRVPALSSVGLVGATGSGKTTAVDLILGLLRPETGSLVVDGEVLEGARIRMWQRSLGYVPQQIFLTDETIAANIAFGLPRERIDMARVEQAARMANLHEFVAEQLPNGYQTAVGERGVRLSGGQRQRIGIARALYNDPDVLVLDEATSALDNLTEQAVMDAVRRLGGKKTVIMIAHRLGTVRNCDRIFVLDQGRVLDSGSYEELLERSERFRAMAEAS